MSFSLLFTSLRPQASIQQIVLPYATAVDKVTFKKQEYTIKGTTVIIQNQSPKDFQTVTDKTECKIFPTK